MPKGVSKEKLEAETKKLVDVATKEKTLTTLREIYVMAGYTHEKFYSYFPVGSDGYNAILAVAEDNKLRLKLKVKDRLAKNNNPAALIALYKVLASEEERNALNGTSEKEGKVSKDTKITLTIN